jgi:hypothetical protein
MINNLYINQLGLSENKLISEIENETLTLINHPLYNSIKTEEDVRIYMFNQVWCVWDFMTLVKSIQLNIVPSNILWMPPKYPELGAYIYEVLLTEETDKGYNSETNSSHFQTYLKAMYESKVDTSSVAAFIKLLENGFDFGTATEKCGIHDEAKEFISTTFEFAKSELHISTAVFCLSREGVIPDIFMNLLANVSLSNNFKIFNWYLNRHIYLDSQSHGPLSIKLFKTIVDTPKKQDEALHASLKALKARNKFFDYILNSINQKNNKK